MKPHNNSLLKNILSFALIFSSMMLLGMYTPQATVLRKKHETGLMRRRQLVFDSAGQQGRIYRIPVDSASLKNLDLCPLFTKQQNYTMDSNLFAEMQQDLRRQGVSEQDIMQQLVGLTEVSGPKCHVFKTNDMGAYLEEKPVGFDVPCKISLGRFGKNNRSLLQLKSLDQFELAEKTSLSPALCGGNALNNACLILDYANTGESKYLSYLHSLNDAANFLLNLNIGDWINVEVIKKNLEKMNHELNIDTSSIFAVSSAALFNSDLDKTPEFALYDSNEFTYVQKIKSILRDSLQKDYSAQVIIIGNEESTETHGHYFAFAIIKSLNAIQYIVLDTLPNVYHLQEGSYERDRLMYIIDNIEQGFSQINFINIRAYTLRLQGAFDVSTQQ